MPFRRVRTRARVAVVHVEINGVLPRAIYRLRSDARVRRKPSRVMADSTVARSRRKRAISFQFQMRPLRKSRRNVRRRPANGPSADKLDSHGRYVSAARRSGGHNGLHTFSSLRVRYVELNIVVLYSVWGKTTSFRRSRRFSGETSLF